METASAAGRIVSPAGVGKGNVVRREELLTRLFVVRRSAGRTMSNIAENPGETATVVGWITWQAGYKRKAEGNPLWKHAVDKHGGRLDVDFRMEVVDTFGRDNTARMTDESLRISRHKGVKLNSKKEYRQPSLPRLQIQRGRNSQ